MPHRPVPPVVDGETLEQRLVALEQLLAGVQEQALAETPRARQEVVLSLLEQLPNVSGLVHVVAAPFPDLAEGLHADGQLASSHGHAPRGVAASVHCRIRGLLRSRGGRTDVPGGQPAASPKRHRRPRGVPRPGQSVSQSHSRQRVKLLPCFLEPGDCPFRAGRARVGAHESGRVDHRRDAGRELEDQPDGGALLCRGDGGTRCGGALPLRGEQPTGRRPRTVRVSSSTRG